MPTLSASANAPRATDVVESFLDALRALDVERALELLDDDIVYQNYPMPPQRGKRSVRLTLKLFARYAEQFDVRMHNIAERDGVVLTERNDIIRGPLVDLDFWVCGTFALRQGKIVLWRDRFDVGGFLLQLATSPVRRLLSAR